MSGERSSRVDVVCLCVPQLAVTVGAAGVCCSLLTFLLTTYYVHTLTRTYFKLQIYGNYGMIYSTMLDFYLVQFMVIHYSRFS